MLDPPHGALRATWSVCRTYSTRLLCWPWLAPGRRGLARRDADLRRGKNTHSLTSTESTSISGYGILVPKHHIKIRGVGLRLELHCGGAFTRRSSHLFCQTSVSDSRTYALWVSRLRSTAVPSSDQSLWIDVITINLNRPEGTICQYGG